MNNYSFLERLLHKFALSSQLIREVTFDVESSLLSSESDFERHVFIAGLARSGTTVLLNSLYESNIFASLTYKDMPFILGPNLWSKISSNKVNIDFKERYHGDGIKFSIESPEAFEEVFWKTFDENESGTVDKFRIFINNVLKKYKKNRYLSKNNQNIRRLALISDNYNHSKVLIPFRFPIQHCFSLLTQHKRFIKFSKKDRFISKYMKLIGHTEFGPNYFPINSEKIFFKNDLDINHWIEQWNLTYKNCLENFIDKKNVYFISYEKLCTSTDYWIEILNKLEIKEIYAYSFKESKREINLEIDSDLYKESLSLFHELNRIINK